MTAMRLFAALGACCALLLTSRPAYSAEKAAPAVKPEPKADAKDAAKANPKSDPKADKDAARDEPKPEEAKVEEPVPATPEDFDKALAAHHAGRFREAAPLFYAFLRGSARTADNYEWAEYFLAEDLAQLGFSHAAVVYFSSVAKTRTRSELLPVALAALEKLTENAPYDSELVEREVLYVTDFGFISGSVADYVAFHKGLTAYKDGQLRWAWNYFDKLPPGHYAARAKLVKALHKLSHDSDADSALADFEALAADEQAPRVVRNDARIAAARLYYERGQYEQAHLAYDSVDLPELDPGRGQLYLEKAWTYYRTGDAPRAMGLLLALEAPSFRELFLPEKYVLAGLIFKDRCHFLPAKRAARGFSRRYNAALTLIRERGELKGDPRLLGAALQIDPTTKRAGDLVETMTREKDLVDNFASRFDKSGLTLMLRQLYTRALSEAVRQREALMQKALIAAADRLLRDEEQVRLLDYEVGLDLYKRIKKGTAQAKLALKDEPLDPADVAYEYDGEYWNDELKDFRMLLPSRCRAVEADK